MLTKKRVLFAIILALLILAAFYVKHWFEIDKCLDNGGRWNYSADICEYSVEEKK